MNRSVTIRAAVGQGQAGSVVVPSVALQTQGGFAHGKQIRVGRAVRGMTSHAVFRYWWMLVGKGSAILGMTAQTEPVGIRHAQIISRGSAMRIVAICTTHLSFPQRVMVRQAHLTALSLVAPQTSIVGLPARLHDGFGFRDQVLNVTHSRWGHHVQTAVVFRVALRTVVVRLVAIRATQLVGGVPSGRPIAQVRIACVTTQTDSVGVMRGTLPERDDFGNIAAPLHMQTSGTVALLALHSLLEMEGVPIVFAYFGMTRNTRITARGSSSGDLRILRKGSEGGV